MKLEINMQVFSAFLILFIFFLKSFIFLNSANFQKERGGETNFSRNYTPLFFPNFILK